MKRFEFVEGSRYSSHVRRGRRCNPYYALWLERMGMTWRDKPRGFTEAEMLKMLVGSSARKRIATMREGTTIRLHKMHSTADMYARRMTADEIVKEDVENKYRAELKAVRAKIYAAIPQALKDEEKRLAKLLKAKVVSVEDDED